MEKSESRILKEREETKYEVEDSQEIKKKKSKNIKIYPIYRMLSWDLLFYYAIIYLFFTIEKKISVSEVLQLEAYYILFKFITQIPCTILIEKIGKRKSLIIANFVLAIHMLLIIFSLNFTWLLISQILCAFSFIIKSTCESDMLYDSIERGEKRGVKFSKIEGKSTAKYYYIDAISAIISSFLFVVNPYLPLIICFLLLLASTFVSMKFEEIQQKYKKVRIKDELKDVVKSFKHICKSKRIISLLIFNAVFVTILKALQTLRNTALKEIGMPDQYFGIIFAILGVISGIAARNQGRIHKKYRNRTLSFMAIPLATSCLLMGLVLLSGLGNQINTPLILGLFVTQYIMKGPYYILIKQYLNNFTDSKTRVRISTVNNLFENIFVSIVLFVVSCIVEILPISKSLLIIGTISLICVVILLEYMKTTVGKKPEEYGKKDLIKEI